MNIDGPNPVRVAGNVDGNTWDSTNHTWSPDSRWVLFNDQRLIVSVCNEGDVCKIYKAKADGTSIVTISGEDVDEYSAFWSPDGNWIAYSTIDCGGDFTICTLSIMRPDGTDKRVLVQKTWDDTEWETVSAHKSWSPDSKWIIFNKQSEAANQKSIFEVNIETKEQIRLTKDYWDGRAFWSPDNTRILFQDDLGEVTIPECTSRDNGDYGKDLLVLNLNPVYFPLFRPIPRAKPMPR